jgi:hypothetical protein
VPPASQRGLDIVGTVVGEAEQVLERPERVRIQPVRISSSNGPLSVNTPCRPLDGPARRDSMALAEPQRRA